MKNKHKKILNYIFILLIINSSLIYSIKADNKSNFTNNDDVDQYQTQSDIFEEIYGDIYIGQSFRPDLGNLTRIELLLSKNGNINFNLTVGIREELTNIDFINISIPPSRISSQEQWIQIDFTNIKLNTEIKYYIICKTKNGDQNNNYRWHASATDIYKDGTQYYTNNTGETWSQNVSRDLCFITHGKEIIEELQLEITYIRGMFGKEIIYGLKNTGETDINNIQVNLTIDVGSLLKSKKQYFETYDDPLKPGKPINGFFKIFVLRPITFGNMIFSVSAENIDTISRKGTLFFFFSYIYLNIS